MKATAKDLRFYSKELLEAANRGEEIVITYRGKPYAKLVPIEKRPKVAEEEGHALFGIWKDNDQIQNVEEYLKLLRKGRFIRKALRQWNSKIVYINEEISAKAIFFVERHYLSHTLQLADALIAATALTSGIPLLTANDKHYRVIKELEIKKFRP